MIAVQQAETDADLEAWIRVMRAVNERLGYECRNVSITMLAPLPLMNLD